MKRSSPKPVSAHKREELPLTVELDHPGHAPELLATEAALLIVRNLLANEVHRLGRRDVVARRNRPEQVEAEQIGVFLPGQLVRIA